MSSLVLFVEENKWSMLVLSIILTLLKYSSTQVFCLHHCIVFSQGYFMRPVVITNVSDDSKLMQEEAFGPVTCVVPFKTEEEVCTCK